jgi:DNA-directed RNA polymerase subunit RPC12/RpoP
LPTSFQSVFSRDVGIPLPRLDNSQVGTTRCVSTLKQKRKAVSVMQEDVLGTRRTAVSETYVNCARCGKATRLRYARIIQSDVLSDSHSEFEYLCPECQKALAEGEKDLPLS